ncbi:MAG: hypothetical protein K9L74_07200 [Candidatus Izimaplasma sp.]|nr:hypothetical protein [Candidatus Izimaplasma bacterium]
MKVYAEHTKIESFLNKQTLENIEIISNKYQANYIISGQYKSTDFNPNLKGVIIPYTGHNGIDLAAMRDKDLELYVTPTRSKYVSEKAVTLTLALLGKTINYHENLKHGNWANRNSKKRVPWISLQNLTVGLFGYGRIGSHIHTLLTGFGCEIYTIDRNHKYPKDLKLVKNLTNLIQVSDIIIISVPLNKNTEGIFDHNRLSRMNLKYLVNVGRGKIVDEKSLYEALKNNNLGGYASDVWYNYPKNKEKTYPSDYPIYEFDNVVLSNHSGGFTRSTNQEVNQDLIKQLRDINEGKKPNLLNVHEII